MIVLKIIGKILLFPVLIVLAIIYALVWIVVNILGLAKGLFSLILGIIFVMALIWYRDDYMLFAEIAIMEFLAFSVMFVGGFIEVLLETAIRGIGSFIIR